MPGPFDGFKQDLANPPDTVAPTDDRPVTDGTVYGNIRSFESNFPIPAPEETVLVGTLDVSNGLFDAAVSIPPTFPGGLAAMKPSAFGGQGPPASAGGPGQVIGPDIPDPVEPPVPTDPLVVIDAVIAVLEFRIKVPLHSLSVTANGITVTAPQGSQSLFVNVGQATVVNWSFSSGGVTIADRLLIRRPPIIGAGAFTIPALPIGIVYDPPVDQAKKNVASLSTSNAVGVTTANSFTNDSSTTTPARGRYSGLSDIQSAMNNFATGLKNIPDPRAQALAKGLELVSGALGQASSSQTVGTKVTQNHSLSVTLTTNTTFNADTHRGPGVGDRIIVLKDVQLVWLAEGGQVTLAMLGHDSLSAPTIQALKEDRSGQSSSTGLDAETIDALLAMDPLAANAQAQLSSDRYELMEIYNVTEGSQSVSLSHTVSSVDQQATTEYRSRVDDHRKGILSFVGLGVTATETVKTVLSLSNSIQDVQSQTTTATVQLSAQPGEHYSVEVYYDRVFGSFAFRALTDAIQPFVHGVLTDAAGQVLQGRSVALTQFGRRYVTVSDAQGRYAFFSSTLAGGGAVLSAEGAEQSVNLLPGSANLQVNLQK